MPLGCKLKNVHGQHNEVQADKQKCCLTHDLYDEEWQLDNSISHFLNLTEGALVHYLKRRALSRESLLYKAHKAKLTLPCDYAFFVTIGSEHTGYLG